MRPEEAISSTPDSRSPIACKMPVVDQRNSKNSGEVNARLHNTRRCLSTFKHLENSVFLRARDLHMAYASWSVALLHSPGALLKKSRWKLQSNLQSVWMVSTGEQPASIKLTASTHTRIFKVRMLWDEQGWRVEEIAACAEAAPWWVKKSAFVKRRLRGNATRTFTTPFDEEKVYQQSQKYKTWPEKHYRNRFLRYVNIYTAYGTVRELWQWSKCGYAT